MRTTPLLLGLVLLLCAGCTPYRSKFTQCPGLEHGKPCFSISEAYVDSIENPPPPVPREGEIRKRAEQKGNPEARGREALFDDYQSQRMLRELSVLREPQVPLVLPPKVLRMLILSYIGDDNELVHAHFTSVMVEEPRFTVGVEPER